MTREEIFERITVIFREEFDDDTLVIVDESNAEDIEDWDSLEHINLVAAVEQEFGIKFTMAQVMGMKDVGEMVGIILGDA